MTVKEKLIGLIQSAVGGCARHWAELIADKLIANGVMLQKWEPVGDPPPIGKCLAYSQVYGEMAVGPIHFEHFEDESDSCFTCEASENGQNPLFDVTHWMPLPVPPKEA